MAETLFTISNVARAISFLLLALIFMVWRRKATSSLIKWVLGITLFVASMMALGFAGVIRERAVNRMAEATVKKALYGDTESMTPTPNPTIAVNPDQHRQVQSNQTSTGLAVESGPVVEIKNDALLFVQVGAFRTEAAAVQMSRHLGSQGILTEVSFTTLQDRPVYRVRLGPFTDWNKAQDAHNQLHQAGYTAVLIRKQVAN